MIYSINTLINKQFVFSDGKCTFLIHYTKPNIYNAALLRKLMGFVQKFLNYKKSVLLEELICISER
ncbi:MAG: hypothetical protein CVU09_14005 [Bacteroidetes bacterium HGW-Bacteroidetes-4]|nr:MAG: hypothetical protein CVU09_14005 [Bacteroidetes bacterium HGW-Bacteroidetes-4]